MSSNISKINLENIIIKIINTGYIEDTDVFLEYNTNFKSKAISINEESFKLWELIFKDDTLLDNSSLLIIKDFYSFTSRLTDPKLYLNCVNLLNNYIKISLKDVSNTQNTIYRVI